MRNIFLALLSLIIFNACKTKIEVFQSVVEGHKLASYTTYSIMSWDTEIDKFLNKEDGEMLLAAVKKEFEARGMTYARTGKGDVYVGIHILHKTSRGRELYNKYYQDNGPDFKYTDTLFYGYPDSEVVRPEGTLIIDVFERKNKSLVWQGGAVSVIQAGTGGPEPLIQKAVAKVFEQYPVPAAKKNAE